jgi:hypothetical protein
MTPQQQQPPEQQLHPSRRCAGRHFAARGRVRPGVPDSLGNVVCSIQGPPQLPGVVVRRSFRSCRNGALVTFHGRGAKPSRTNDALDGTATRCRPFCCLCGSTTRKPHKIYCDAGDVTRLFRSMHSTIRQRGDDGPCIMIWPDFISKVIDIRHASVPKLDVSASFFPARVASNGPTWAPIGLWKQNGHYCRPFRFATVPRPALSSSGHVFGHPRRFLSDRPSRNANELLGPLDPSRWRPSYSRKRRLTKLTDRTDRREQEQSWLAAREGQTTTSTTKTSTTTLEQVLGVFCLTRNRFMLR